jgi:hypothetical protein
LLLFTFNFKIILLRHLNIFFVVCNQQLRVNEFGIYELVPGEESTAEKPIEAIPIAEVVSASEKESVTSEPITTSSDAEAISQTSKPGLSLSCQYL